MMQVKCNCAHCGVVLLPHHTQVKIHPMTPHEFTLCYDCYVKWQLKRYGQRGSIHPTLALFIGLLLLLALALFARTCSAQELELGKVVGVHAPMCFSLKETVKLANLDKEKGPPAVIEVLKGSKLCGIGRVVAKLVKVRYSIETPRGQTHVIEVEVELVDGSWKTLFILTDVRVKGLRDA